MRRALPKRAYVVSCYTATYRTHAVRPIGHLYLFTYSFHITLSPSDVKILFYAWSEILQENLCQVVMKYYEN